MASKRIMACLRRSDGSVARRTQGAGLVQPEALALGLVVVAALIERDRERLVAARGAIGACEIAHGVGEVGVGVEQPLCRAGVAERAGRRVLDLHQAHGAAAADGAGVVAAFARDHLAHQRLGHAIRLGVARDQCVITLRRCRRQRARKNRQCQKERSHPRLRRCPVLPADWGLSMRTIGPYMGKKTCSPLPVAEQCWRRVPRRRKRRAPCPPFPPIKPWPSPPSPPGSRPSPAAATPSPSSACSATPARGKPRSPATSPRASTARSSSRPSPARRRWSCATRAAKAPPPSTA